jgi:hypothetical protein
MSPPPWTNGGSTASGRITSSDQALAILNTGSEQDKTEARTYLARVFGERGMSAEATELLEANARAGVQDPGLFTTLAGHYRSQGRSADADAAMAHAAMLLSRQQSVPQAPVYQQPPVAYQAPPVQYYPQPAAPIQNVVVNNVVTVGAVGGGHLPMIIRLLFFLLIGWWFGFVWIGVALATFPFIVTIPLGIWMLNRTSRAFIL